MEEEKRRRYRLSTESLDPLRVELIPAEGEPLVAEVTDLNAEGACLYVPPAPTATLEVEEPVTLRFHGAVLAEPFEVEALVRRHRSCDDGDDYGLEFVDGDLQRQGLPPEVRWIFNLRSTLRVRPETSQPIEVVISSDDSSCHSRTALLHDVSVLGVSVVVRVPVDLWLATAETVRVSFALPDGELVLGFVGQVLRSTLRCGKGILGLRLRGCVAGGGSARPTVVG